MQVANFFCYFFSNNTMGENMKFQFTYGVY